MHCSPVLIVFFLFNCFSVGHPISSFYKLYNQKEISTIQKQLACHLYKNSNGVAKEYKTLVRQLYDVCKGNIKNSSEIEKNIEKVSDELQNLSPQYQENKILLGIFIQITSLFSIFVIYMKHCHSKTKTSNKTQKEVRTGDELNGEHDFTQAGYHYCELKQSASSSKVNNCITDGKLNGSLLLTCFQMFSQVLFYISLFSSSFIEEEQYLWYYFVPTLFFILMVFRAYITRINDDFVYKLLIILILLRVAKTWNRTGVKWISIPDTGDWLVLNQNQHYLVTLLIISSIIMLILLLNSESFVGNFMLCCGCFFILIYKLLVTNTYTFGNYVNYLTKDLLVLFIPQFVYIQVFIGFLLTQFGYMKVYRTPWLILVLLLLKIQNIPWFCIIVIIENTLTKEVLNW